MKQKLQLLNYIITNLLVELKLPFTNDAIKLPCFHVEIIETKIRLCKELGLYGVEIHEILRRIELALTLYDHKIGDFVRISTGKVSWQFSIDSEETRELRIKTILSGFLTGE